MDDYELKVKLISECEYAMKKFISETDEFFIKSISGRIVFIQLLFYQLYGLDVNHFVDCNVVDEFYNCSNINYFKAE